MKCASPILQTGPFQGVAVFTLKCRAPVSPWPSYDPFILHHPEQLGVRKYLGIHVCGDVLVVHPNPGV